MYLFRNLKMERKTTSCYICGHEICEEDSDHLKLTFEEFTLLMEQNAGFVPQIAKLKSKIKKAFLKLENHGKINLGFEINRLHLLLDKLHFWYLLESLPSLKIVQSFIYGFMLTKAQTIKLLGCLTSQIRRQMRFPAFDELLKEVHVFKKNIRSISDNGDYDYLMRKFIEIIDREENKQKGRNQNTQNNLYAGQPNIAQQISNAQYVLIYGLPFSIERSSIDLSTLQLDDRTLLTIMPALEKMNKIKQFQLRNNQLTKIGYKMLFNILPCTLQSLDLSGSNSDNFIDLLFGKFPNLKCLYLNEINISSEDKLQLIVNAFPYLKVLYLNENKLSIEMMQGLISKEYGLMYVSMKGNSIDENQGQKMVGYFLKKGGYFEF